MGNMLFDFILHPAFVVFVLIALFAAVVALVIAHRQKQLSAGLKAILISVVVLCVLYLLFMVSFTLLRVFIFLLQSGNIFFVDPFLRVAAGAANIPVDKHSGEIAPSGLNVIADTVCSGLARNFDDVCAVALGTNLPVLHIVAPYPNVSSWGNASFLMTPHILSM